MPLSKKRNAERMKRARRKVKNVQPKRLPKKDGYGNNLDADGNIIWDT